MGGHYGSIHVRTDDREIVKTAVVALNTSAKRFLIAPPLNGCGLQLHGRLGSVNPSVCSAVSPRKRMAYSVDSIGTIGVLIC
jgi:hypothetical protein